MIDETMQNVRNLYEKWRELANKLDPELSGLLNRYIDYTFLNQFSLESKIDDLTYFKLVESTILDVLRLIYVDYFKTLKTKGQLQKFYEQSHLYNTYVSALISFLVAIKDIYRREKNYIIKLLRSSPNIGATIPIQELIRDEK